MPVFLPYPLLADMVLALHVAVAAFVVGGLALIVGGNLLGWRWVNGLWFRLSHLAAITVIAAQAWFGAACPLTTLERWLRSRAGEDVYGGGWLAHWLQRLLYYQGPDWVFILAYSLFGLAVTLAWWVFPPKRRH